MSTLINDLKSKWEALKTENPHLRIRNAAEQLGASEAELLATNIGNGVTVLKPEFASLLQEVVKLDKVMALTRNDECVHERKGVYLNPDFSNPHGQVFDVLTEKYKADEQSSDIVTEPIAPKPAEKADSEIDVAGFQQAWKDLQDTHDFFMMTKKFGVSRTQALRLAPEGFAQKIDNSKVVNVLEDASEKRIPIMVFVGNRGIIQIHTGEVKKTLWHQQWFNVMDPYFNLHLDTTKIGETWITKKPTEDGEVTSVEVFNKEGEFIVQFFGKRKPGTPELQEWKDLVAGL